MKVRFKSRVTRGFSFSPLRDSCSPLRGSLIRKKRKTPGTRVQSWRHCSETRAFQHSRLSESGAKMIPQLGPFSPRSRSFLSPRARSTPSSEVRLTINQRSFYFFEVLRFHCIFSLYSWLINTFL